MAGVDELNRFECPRPSAPFASADVAISEYVSRGKIAYKDLIFVRRNVDGSHTDDGMLEVLQLDRHAVQPVGLISVARILFSSTELPAAFKYEIQVLFSSFRSGSVHTADEFMDVCSIISVQGGYKYCPGIEVDHYYQYFFSMIRYHIKSCRVWEQPFIRIDSVNCLLWHKLARNATAEERRSKSALCKSCKRLCCDLEHQRRRSDVSFSKRAARLLPSSNFKLKYLSPQSVSKRKEATLREQSRDKAVIAKLSPDIVLEDDQSDEMATILETIEEEAPDELENVFKEADGQSVGTAVRNIWETDKRNAKTIFNKDQQVNRKYTVYRSIVKYFTSF